jgi:hypothetical protein
MSNIYDKSSLVLIPSGTKTGKVFSQKPVSGDGDFTFTRASAATRVNADGNIEKETQNLLRYSNVFDNINWNKINTSVTSGQAGFDGSSNAWLLTKTAANGNIYQSQGYSGVQTLSFYVKANTTDWVRIRSGGGYAYFDVANGNIGIRTNDIDSSITSVANGWYRIEVVWSGSNGISQLFVADSDGVLSGTSGSVYIQYPQLEDGLVAREYLDAPTNPVYGGITDNTPRLDYTDSSCPALLLEPQRTNRFAHSEYSGGFNSGAAIAITNNQAISPEGLQNAFKIEKTSNNYAYLRTGLAATTGCLSVFAKKGNYRYIGLRNNQINGTHSTFDFDTETFVVVASGQTCTFEDYGNGWYRLTAYQPNNEGSIYQGIAIVKANGSELLDSSVPNGSHFFVYGLQNEIGSYATSYIPTYGSSVTRTAEDVINTNTSGIIGQVDGMIYLEMSALGDDGTFRQVTLSDGTSSNLIHFDYSSSSNGLRVFTRKSGAASSFTYTMTDTTSNAKFALKYADNDYRLFINGVKVATNTTCLTPLNLSDIEFDNGSGSNNLEARLNQFMIFPTALTDQEAIDLTTI